MENEEKMLVYVSAAVVKFTIAQLESLLARARVNNARNNITGVLLYCDGNFMQCLEGPIDAVQSTFRRIEYDPSHTGLIRLIEMPITKRSFS